MSRDDSLRDTLRPLVHELVVDLWAAEAAARDFSDLEGVHRMRVTSRKLRAALDTSGMFDRKPERRLRKRIRQLARALGAVRDGDVMIAGLGNGSNRPGVLRLVRRLERQRDVDRERLLSMLDAMDADGFREVSLSTFAAKPGGKRRKIRKRDARALVAQPRDELAAISGTLPDEDDIEGLHLLRIAAKRLRYVLQLVGPALAPESTRALEALSTMQDMLGDIHNDDVLIALVRDELHALAGEEIARALEGETTADAATVEAREDLLALLAETAQDRHARYAAFSAWREEIERAGIATVGAPRTRR